MQNLPARRPSERYWLLIVSAVIHDYRLTSGALRERQRRKRFSREALELPHGNYDFRGLAYAEQAEFQILCARYGWDPDAAEVDIDPLTLWADENLLELYDFLEKAVPETEKAMR